MLLGEKVNKSANHAAHNLAVGAAPCENVLKYCV